MDDALPIVRSALACGILLGTLWLVAAAIRRLRESRSAASLVAAWMRRFGVRRLATASASHRVATGLRLVDRLALGPGTGIALVRCEGRSLVLGIGTGAPVVLADFEPDAAFEADGRAVSRARRSAAWKSPRPLRRGRAPRRSYTNPQWRDVTSRSSSRASESSSSREPEP